MNIWQQLCFVMCWLVLIKAEGPLHMLITWAWRNLQLPCLICQDWQPKAMRLLMPTRWRLACLFFLSKMAGKLWTGVIFSMQFRGARERHALGSRRGIKARL